MYFTVLSLPFLSFFITNLFGRKIGIYGSCLISTFLIFCTFLSSIFIFFEVCFFNCCCILSLSDWFSTELILIPWSFYFDEIVVSMLIIVSCVSWLVHFFSTGYLITDPHLGRFMGYLSLFTGFMLILVAADNFVVMFLGWEGIGLASFLLISFWHTRIQANKSAIKAMLVNRVGDLGLVLGICFIFNTFKSVDYLLVFALIPKVIDTNCNLFVDVDILTIISFLLFWGAVGKSAQIGLHMWLPDAMEGPTPVSALIHAATLVTAGVFLIIRCSCIFDNSHFLNFVVFIGAFTALFASSIGLVQNDIKRIIAFSTCSQIGYMVLCAGLSQFSVALFHLLNHALFKALLFLSAGCVIHGLYDEQDIRKMGSLAKIFPISYVMILIGSIALGGIPFLSGFYSKEAILECSITKYTSIGNFAYILGCFAAFCTAFYSCRLLLLVFFIKNNSYSFYIKKAHEASLIMIFPLLILSLGTFLCGFLAKDLFIGLGFNIFSSNYTVPIINSNFIDAEQLSWKLKTIPLLFTLLAIFIGILCIHFINKSKLFKLKKVLFFNFIFINLIQKWHIDQILNELFVFKIMNFGYSNSFKLIDKGNIEKFGPVGILKNLQTFSSNFVKIQTGFIINYIFIFINVVFLFIFLFFLPFNFLNNSLCIINLVYLVYILFLLN